MGNLVSDEIHVGDVQTKFLLTIKDGTTVVDVSDPVDSWFIKFEKPDGTLADLVAAFETDGTDGKVFVLSNITTLVIDQAGKWKMQARVGISTTSPASLWYSNVEEFQVFEVL